MNITFFVGNGFDLRLGLNTRYSDFYDYFKSNSSSENIILKWMQDKDPLWSDLELSLGKHLNNLSLSELERFYKDRLEMEDHLYNYLEKEEKRFEIDGKEDQVSKEFIRSIIGFQDGLNLADKRLVSRILKTYSNHDYSYCFVDFNYTNCLDQIVDVAKKNNPVNAHKFSASTLNENIDTIHHVHGTLDNGMILGVNDSSQINNEELCNEPGFLNVFVKEKMNKGIGELNVEKAEEILGKSIIVAIYGMSIGDTDKYWWEAIGDWLMKSPDHLLVIYHYGNETALKRRNPQRIINTTNKIKRDFLSKTRIDFKNRNNESLSERILISYGNDLFNFADVVK